MGKTVLYVYAMTNDSGFAPCVAEGLLTLACCKGGKKGGMRLSAAKHFKAGNDVWVLGVCGKSLADRYGKTAYAPVYLARITAVTEMTEYYKDDKYRGRIDGRAYELRDGALAATDDNPHGKDDREKDIGGKYVLLSSNFTYWGDKCGENGNPIERCFPSVFHTDTDSGKCGIDKHYRGYIVDEDFPEFAEEARKSKWIPNPDAEPSYNIISAKTINGGYIPDENENSEEEVKTCFSCGGGRK